MSKTFGIGFGIAALVIIGLIWFGFINTKGNHLAPSGWISSVRVLPLDDEITLMVIDFGILNDSDVQMTVAKIDPWITTPDGRDIHGSLYASGDMEKTFKFYPALGPMLHPPLPQRGTIDLHKTINNMIGVGFDVSSKVVESRTGLTLRVEDITGPFVELTSK